MKLRPGPARGVGLGSGPGPGLGPLVAITPVEKRYFADDTSRTATILLHRRPNRSVGLVAATAELISAS